MIRWLRSSRSYPVLVVALASIAMFAVIRSSDPIGLTVPVFLFNSAKLIVLFGLVEIAHSVSGMYKYKDRVYSSNSRAITAFGMAISFMLLLGAYEVARQ